MIEGTKYKSTTNHTCHHLQLHQLCLRCHKPIQQYYKQKQRNKCRLHPTVYTNTYECNDGIIHDKNNNKTNSNNAHNSNSNARADNGINNKCITSKNKNNKDVKIKSKNNKDREKKSTMQPITTPSSTTMMPTPSPMQPLKIMIKTSPATFHQLILKMIALLLPQNSIMIIILKKNL